MSVAPVSTDRSREWPWQLQLSGRRVLTSGSVVGGVWRGLLREKAFQLGPSHEASTSRANARQEPEPDPVPYRTEWRAAPLGNFFEQQELITINRHARYLT
jgi:hypothetical protein